MLSSTGWRDVCRLTAELYTLDDTLRMLSSTGNSRGFLAGCHRASRMGDYATRCRRVWLERVLGGWEQPSTPEHVAASTQNGALNALLFLYRSVLQQSFPQLEDVERAKRPRRFPTVFTRPEVHTSLTRLSGMPHLMASLLYGAGLRLMECVRLRVKDVDFTCQQITVRDGKGAQDRVTMLLRSLAEPLQRHLARGASPPRRRSPRRIWRGVLAIRL
jgi:integrase